MLSESDVLYVKRASFRERSVVGKAVGTASRESPSHCMGFCTRIRGGVPKLLRELEREILAVRVPERNVKKSTKSHCGVSGILMFVRDSVR